MFPVVGQASDRLTGAKGTGHCLGFFMANIVKYPPPSGGGLYRTQSARRNFLAFFPYIWLEPNFHIYHRLGGGGSGPPSKR
jgi:hypothetical protein